MSTHDTRASGGENEGGGGDGDRTGFGEFFRSYTKTWIHAVATAGLTAFGTLTFVHRWFAVLALAAYVVPPIVLYARRASDDESSAQRASAPSRDAKPTETTGTERTEDRQTETANRSEATPDGVNATEPRSEPVAVGEGRDRSDEEQHRSPRDDSENGLASDRDPDQPGDWQPVDTPTDETLLDGAVVDGSGAYAVGTCGVVLETAGGDGPSIVLEDGPGANANDLHGIDATADGAAVWVAGDNGAVGRIDVETGRHTDYSAPNNLTDNLSGIAVGGTASEETILLINGSGEVLRGRYDGERTDREAKAEPLTWDDPIKPGSGSSCSGVDLVDPSTGYCCDTSNGVFETTDGGQSFDRIGLESADGTLVAIAALERGDCLVGADDGVVHRYDGPAWTPERVGDGSLAGLDRHGERTVACDEETIYERATPTADWERVGLETESALLGISIGSTGGVAVGEDGTLVEQ
ncbi:hypothetical protein OB955_17625 [Halobacteria archaeon AArc-m2/3/4]|uniref:Uncharacterized protein n=1 Tax=Natronoglomus mannanivorans TaxID=2979990 RepID=A0ABT2QHX5_9EURY|nr:hypothetical protein [Halobacteria archaeon AArc-m2/3/4]